MAYWEEVRDAAIYTAILYINETPISKKIVQRGELYCSFKGLAPIDGSDEELIGNKIANHIVRFCRAVTFNSYGIGGYFIKDGDFLRLGKKNTPTSQNYFIQVEAENRNGEIIAISDKVKCEVKGF